MLRLIKINMAESGDAETEVAENTTSETASSEPDTFELAITRCREFNNLLYYEKNVTVRVATFLPLKRSSK